MAQSLCKCSLTVRAQQLEFQERLYKHQIRLGLREILQQELEFYERALGNINACASILSGFAFTGLCLEPFDGAGYLSSFLHEVAETCFNLFCTLCVCLGLLTVIYSNYLALFSTRLALRGGERAVEDSVVGVRGEYKWVLYALTLTVMSFAASLTFLGFYKMQHKVDHFGMFILSIPTLLLVVVAYRRARALFFLSAERFAPATDHASGSEIFRPTEHAGYGTRLSEIARDVDIRNQASILDIRNQGSIMNISEEKMLNMSNNSIIEESTESVYEEMNANPVIEPYECEDDELGKAASRLFRSRYYKMFSNKVLGKSGTSPSTLSTDMSGKKSEGSIRTQQNRFS